MSKLILLIQFVTTGLLIVAICVPLILGWIPPNAWYGFRTRQTLADPSVWYTANAAAGKRLSAAALTIVCGAIGFYFVPTWELPHYAIANLAVTILALAYAVLQSMVDLKGLQPVAKPSQPVENDPAQDEPAKEDASE